ncbi:hypothetical protein WMF23_26490 [Sorangium sp. So ce542]
MVCSNMMPWFGTLPFTQPCTSPVRLTVYRAELPTMNEPSTASPLAAACEFHVIVY